MNILDIDGQLTVAINSFRAEWADGFFYYVSQTWTWLPLAMVLLYFGWREWGWKRLLCVVAGVVVCLLLSDQACNVIKNSVCRLRPTHEPSLAGMIHTVNGYVGGLYGFCSAHACNTATVAAFSGLVVRRRWYAVLGIFWVLLNCWSRIYLGVHYLGDVVCGMVLGFAIAYMVFALYKWLIDRCKYLLEK